MARRGSVRTIDHILADTAPATEKETKKMIMRKMECLLWRIKAHGWVVENVLQPGANAHVFFTDVQLTPLVKYLLLLKTVDNIRLRRKILRSWGLEKRRTREYRWCQWLRWRPYECTIIVLLGTLKNNGRKVGSSNLCGRDSHFLLASKSIIVDVLRHTYYRGHCKISLNNPWWTSAKNDIRPVPFEDWHFCSWTQTLGRSCWSQNKSS